MKYSALSLVVLVVFATCARVPFEAGMYAPDQATIPRFIENDFVDLTQIERISRFRSSAGHNYPDRYETDRSMKHYYKPLDSVGGTNDTIEVFSPVDGTVTMIWDEGVRSNQVRIVSTEYPFLTIVLFHINTTIELGQDLSGGDRIGFADVTSDNPDSPTSDFDIAVWLADGRAISYIGLLTDSLFASYLARGATSRDDFSLTQEFRDANPVTEWNRDYTNDWFDLM